MNEELKRIAGEEAVQEIESGMTIGLGTGSTVFFAINKIAEEIERKNLKDIVAIPSSDRTMRLAQKLNIPLINFNDKQEIDVAIDGADEVDKYLNLIKGGGGAHLREKILAQSSKKFIVVIDESKLSQRLGEKWAIPIEVVKFSLPVIERYIESLNGFPKLRKYDNEKPFITDENNYILDCNFGILQNPFQLAEKLENKSGIVEHGLFLRMTNKVYVATKDGVQVLEK